MEGPPNPICQTPGDPFVGKHHVGPNTPFRIGSNSKTITAAITLTVLKQMLASKGLPATDQDAMNLKILDPSNDLISARLRRVLSAAPTGAGIACNGNVTGDGRPDPRWKDVTVRQLLTHTSGLPRDEHSVTSQLARIRGFSSEADLAADETAIGATQAARATIEGPGGHGHFLRLQSLEEVLIGNADLCFQFDPGGPIPENVSSYSNLGFGLLQHIAEHVSGRPLTAPLAEPEKHDESLLAQFLSTRLGITKGVESKHGIYMSQPIKSLRDSAEPKYRGWDGNTMNGLFSDRKRPWCMWDDETGQCDGTGYDNGSYRFTWDWANAQVGVSYTSPAYFAGAGLLAVELPLYFQYMSKYWVSGSYGRERTEAPSNASHWHIGELVGTHSTAAQFMGDAVEYYPVPRHPNGDLDLSTFTTTWTEDSPTEKCVLPKNLNMVLATNQVSDFQCGTSICGTRYMALRDVVKAALCKVDWLKVKPEITL
jgi:hypothetical protein